MVDLLIPIARNVVVNERFIPIPLRGKVGAAVPTMGALEDLPHALGGRDAKPRQPVLLWGPDGTQIIIMGAGEATAAEIQDLAYQQLDRATTQHKSNGRTHNFDELREQAGLPRREDVDRMIREALHRRAAAHKANPISDPARVPGRGYE